MAALQFEQYRQPWETGPHWELKREFLEKYKDMFDEDRLLCLAQAYSNIVLMNCSYPDPVMRQISLLSQDLQMCKKFQEANKTPEPDIKSFDHQERVSQKMKSIYENSGRPFKQVKFCSSSEKTPVSTISDENNSSGQSDNLSSSIVNNQHISDDCNVTDCAKINENQSSSLLLPSPEKNNFVDLTKEEQNIITTLGTELIQNFVQQIRNYQCKSNSAYETILNAAQKRNLHLRISFDVQPDPKGSPHAPIFTSKFSIDDCIISAETASNKKAAKFKSAESAISVFDKLAGVSLPVSSSPGPSTDSVTFQEPINPFVEGDVMKFLQTFRQQVIKRSKKLTAISAMKKVVKALRSGKHVAYPVTSDSSKQNSEFICKLFIKNVLISSWKSPDINQAKTLAIESGFAKLENLSNYKIQDDKLVDIQAKPIDSDSPESVEKNCIVKTKKPENVPFVLNQQLFNSSMKDNFVMVDTTAVRPHASQRNLKQLIAETFNFCKQKLEYKFDVVETPDLSVVGHRAQVLMSGNVIGTGLAATKDEAKIIACEKTVEALRKKYYTLKFKSEYVDGYIITRNQVFEGESFASGALTDSNIGCKMLKSMGWSGGGLGATGISEPIEAQGQNAFGRGLGFKQQGTGTGDMNLFKKRINSMLQDYSKTDTLSSLVFSKDFTKEERKHIHRLAGKFNLHTASSGTQANRFLTVKHKYSVCQILQYLIKNNGVSSRYELIDNSETPVEL